jgi:PilZ domain
LYTPPRHGTRIVPHRPISVAIDDENGLPLGYGVIPNVSEAGACVWTNCHLEPGGRLVLRVRFAHPAEQVAARVVWTREGDDPLGGPPLRRYGLQWQDFSSACVPRLLHLVREASGGRRAGSHPAVKPFPGPNAP